VLASVVYPSAAASGSASASPARSYHDPQVLILTRPQVARLSTEYTVMQAIQSSPTRKRSSSCAPPDDVQACDQVYVLEAGTVVSHGTFYELLETFRHLRRSLGRRSGRRLGDERAGRRVGRYSSWQPGSQNLVDSLRPVPRRTPPSIRDVTIVTAYVRSTTSLGHRKLVFAPQPLPSIWTG